MIAYLIHLNTRRAACLRCYDGRRYNLRDVDPWESNRHSKAGKTIIQWVNLKLAIDVTGDAYSISQNQHEENITQNFFSCTIVN